MCRQSKTDQLHRRDSGFKDLSTSCNAEPCLDPASNYYKKEVDVIYLFDDIKESFILLDVITVLWLCF